MKEIQSVLIAGAGAIGSLVAWQIQQTDGIKVSLLAGGDRLERYKTEGFIINGKNVHFPLTDTASRSESDLVIIACKFHHLDTIMEDLSRHIGKDTLILSLLNGISSEEILSAKFGRERIPLAMIIGTDAGHYKNEICFSKAGTIFFGDNENSKDPTRWSARITAIANLFLRCDISFTVPENMRNRIWYKFMMNVGLNQVTAVLRAPYKSLQTSTKIPEAAELFESAMHEVIEIAHAEGVTLTNADIEEIYRVIDSLSKEGKTSMCQDVEAGRKTEVGMFALTVMELGKRHNIDVPINTALYLLLRSIEEASGVQV